MAYQYDVFISYSQNDRPWAQKLHADLVALGVRVFFDKDRLDVGRQWESQLKDALSQSKSLIVVWTSDHAQVSDWVSRERAAFWLQPDLGESRCLMSLNLQGRPQADARLQGIEDLLEAGVDPADIGSLHAQHWQKVLHRIKRSLDQTMVAMPVVALTMNRQQAADLPAKHWLEIEKHFGIARQAAIDSYGANRQDWKPLGSQDSLATVLTRLEGRLNQRIKGSVARYYWDFAPAAFWDDTDVAAAFASRMAEPQTPALVIVDPIALRDPVVLDRLYLFQEAVSERNIGIVVLAPFAMPKLQQDLRQWLMSAARAYFAPMFTPEIPPRAPLLAQLALYSGDEDDLLRLTSGLVGDGVRVSQSLGARSPYLKP